ncbi:Uncharacterised protein [Mycobacteroides abscessus subsp. abscessus]|nr:Uncharacterised protein [Mycobacteroides abscessus subsp. abscessus]SKU82452.1 Uncharacterised protein [Mycobacteroides abscessus subsp. abscessus]
MTAPMPKARDWVRSGSTSIRASCSATPDAMRRMTNRHPVTWWPVTNPRRYFSGSGFSLAGVRDAKARRSEFALLSRLSLIS